MLLAWLNVALATTVYINGVRADVLPAVTLPNVTVTVDAKGDLYISAPGYKVEVAPPTYSNGYGPPVPLQNNPQPIAAPLPPVAAASTVAPGAWWLVTEDNQSMGQIVDVVVNGTVVRRVQSGEPQLILDLAPYLHHGANTIAMNAISGTTPLGGGILNLYVGRGINVSGTIRIDPPTCVIRGAPPTRRPRRPASSRSRFLDRDPTPHRSLRRLPTAPPSRRVPLTRDPDWSFSWLCSITRTGPESAPSSSIPTSCCTIPVRCSCSRSTIWSSRSRSSRRSTSSSGS